MSKQTPSAPDYAGATQAQSAASQNLTEQQTWANRPNINTPFGQQTWSVTPTWDPTTQQYLNSWTQDTNLTPEAQASLDSQMRIGQGRSDLAESLLGRAKNDFSQPIDWNSFDPLAETPNAGNYDTNSLPSYGALPTSRQYTPEAIQRSLDTSGLTQIDPSQRYYSNAGDAIYNQFSSRAEPQFTRDTDALRTQLYNQGLREGDQAYDEGMRKLRESQNDARQQASYQATIGAGNEAQRMFGMDSGARQQQFGERSAQGAFANQAAQQALQQQLGIGNQGFQQESSLAALQNQQRQQAGNEQLAFGGQNFNENMNAAEFQNRNRQQQIAEEMQRRGASLNEINSILSGQQVGMPSSPEFNTSGRAQAPDYLGAANSQYGSQMNAFNAQQQQNQSLLQGAAMLAMMFSDIRLKDDIIFRGMDAAGIRWYSYRYIWDHPDIRHVGVMAHEVSHIPGVVHVHPSGYLMVDYGRL